MNLGGIKPCIEISRCLAGKLNQPLSIGSSEKNRKGHLEFY